MKELKDLVKQRKKQLQDVENSAKYREKAKKLSKKQKQIVTEDKRFLEAKHNILKAINSEKSPRTQIKENDQIVRNGHVDYWVSEADCRACKNILHRDDVEWGVHILLDQRHPLGKKLHSFQKQGFKIDFDWGYFHEGRGFGANHHYVRVDAPGYLKLAFD